MANRSHKRADLVGCPEFRRSLEMDRRGFVKAGALGLGGLSLDNLMRAEAAVQDRKKVSREKSVIILWKRGGASQHETWDPKPESPQDYRGAFGAMSTKVPGTQICDLLPRCAKMTDKFAIIRSLHHDQPGHSAGDQVMFTGYPPSKANPNVNVYPSCGSIVAKQLGHLNPGLPSYVMIPRSLPGVEAVYTGEGLEPHYMGPFVKDEPAIAIGKAWGAVGMGMSSRSLEKRALERPHLVEALVAASGGRLVPVAGGVLIRDGDGEIIGTVGVTGDTSDNDEACAVAGNEAVGLIPDWGERSPTTKEKRL